MSSACGSFVSQVESVFIGGKCMGHQARNGAGQDRGGIRHEGNCKEDIMTMRACIMTESHLKTVLEMLRDKPELGAARSLVEAALTEIEAVRRSHAAAFQQAGRRRAR